MISITIERTNAYARERVKVTFEEGSAVLDCSERSFEGERFRNVEVDPELVSRWIQFLSELQLPVTSPGKGLPDATEYRVTVSDGSTTTFEWVAEEPPGWERLSELAEEVVEAAGVDSHS